MTGMGKDVMQARERAYKTVDEIHVADEIVRDDIGLDLKDKIEKLQGYGYAESYVFGEDK